MRGPPLIGVSEFEVETILNKDQFFHKVLLTLNLLFVIQSLLSTRHATNHYVIVVKPIHHSSHVASGS